jgi:hypothetical protein
VRWVDLLSGALVLQRPFPAQGSLMPIRARMAADIGR